MLPFGKMAEGKDWVYKPLTPNLVPIARNTADDDNLQKLTKTALIDLVPNIRLENNNLRNDIKRISQEKDTMKDKLQKANDDKKTMKLDLDKLKGDVKRITGEKDTILPR